MTIKDASTDQLDALPEFMPDLTDSDAKILALRMYYLELSNGVSSIQAQDKVSRMFFVSTRTVRRWAELWEATGEESLFDGRSECGEREKSILFYCPALLFELRQWINERLKLGGRHSDGYLTIQHIQDYIQSTPVISATFVPCAYTIHGPYNVLITGVGLWLCSH